MELKFSCRECGSENFDVIATWEQIVKGTLAAYCKCPGGKPDDQIAAEVGYERPETCRGEGSLEGSEWTTLGDNAEAGEMSYADRVVYCESCYTRFAFPADYDDVKDCEIDVIEGSFVFSVHCGKCHDPIECSEAVAEFIREQFIDE